MFSINNSYNNTPKLQNQMQKVILMNNCSDSKKELQKLCAATQKFVPEYGNFSEISTVYKNKVQNLDIGDIKITVKPSILLSERPDERELEMAVKSKNDLYTYKLVLKRGDLRDIMDYLRNNSTPAQIENVLKQASESFNDVQI